jgi:hypothetical protein
MRRVLFASIAFLAAAALVMTAGSAAAASVNIRYANNAFSPNPATTYVGDALHFCNDSDADISVVIESFTIGPIEPGTCEGNLVVESSDAETGSLSYHCVSPCSATGVVIVQEATTTTAAPTSVPPAATSTTRKPTATTARRTTTATTRRTTATTRRTTATSLDVTTTSEETTTTFFDTTTSELTTTTFGDLAINEEGAGGNGAAVAILASLAVIAGGGGYLIWRNRFRLR